MSHVSLARRCLAVALALALVIAALPLALRLAAAQDQGANAPSVAGLDAAVIAHGVAPLPSG